MNELFIAIQSHFLTDPLFTNRPGLTALYDTEAPADAVFPYGTVSIIGGSPDFTFTEDFENPNIQFNMFSNKSSGKEIGELFNLLKGDKDLGQGFDFKDLTISGYGAVSLVRGESVRTREEKMWKYEVNYSSMFQVS